MFNFAMKVYCNDDECCDKIFKKKLLWSSQAFSCFCLKWKKYNILNMIIVHT